MASGDFQVELDTSRDDELGQLARSFQLMADEVQQREEALRQANEGLEQRVEERTRELKEVHMQLVQTARRAGMAEIATNVLHNVGNVLNSVYTSAQVAKERMTGMRLEHVGRVASMLQERQSDLGTFLTQDERGKHVMPFLDKLGQNLLEERQEIVSLLDDVGRYTEHIGDIVKVQQNYARTPRLHEPVPPGGAGGGRAAHQRGRARPPPGEGGAAPGRPAARAHRQAQGADDPGQPGQQRQVRHGRRDPGRAAPDGEAGAAPARSASASRSTTTAWASRRRCSPASSSMASPRERRGMASACTPAPWRPRSWAAPCTCTATGPGRGATFTLEMPYIPVLETA